MKKLLAVGATAALMLAATSLAFAQDATATDGSTADASVDQSLYIDQYQLNAGFGYAYRYY